MYPRTLTVVLTGVLALALAPAVDAAPEPASLSVLALRIEQIERDDATRWATLRCNPDTGTHPDPATACDQLRAANGHVRRIPPEHGPCTLEYNPTRVTATGLWRGHPRIYSRVHSNPCVANRDTGGVLFTFYG